MCARACPALPPHVDRADDVGIVFIAATNTLKQRLPRTVFLVRTAARRTLAACIGGLNGNHKAAVFELLPFNDLPQSKKARP